MKILILLSLSGLLVWSNAAIAQLLIDAEVRPRGELTHSKKKLASPDEDAVFGISQRTRLNVGYKSEKIDLYISLQDVRMWGSTPQLAVGDGAATTLHQAYGDHDFLPGGLWNS